MSIILRFKPRLQLHLEMPLHDFSWARSQLAGTHFRQLLCRHLVLSPFEPTLSEGSECRVVYSSRLTATKFLTTSCASCFLPRRKVFKMADLLATHSVSAPLLPATLVSSPGAVSSADASLRYLNYFSSSFQVPFQLCALSALDYCSAWLSHYYLVSFDLLQLHAY